MTRKEYIKELENAIEKAKLFAEKVNEVSYEISNLTYSGYARNLAHFRQKCLQDIKTYSSMDDCSFSKINVERIHKELTTRIKSLGLACDALIYEAENTYIPMDIRFPKPPVSSGSEYQNWERQRNQFEEAVKKEQEKREARKQRENDPKIDR